VLSSITADVSTSNAVSDFKLTFSITQKVAPVQKAIEENEENR
jgi:type IV pilus assembly protein PilN